MVLIAGTCDVKAAASDRARLERKYAERLREDPKLKGLVSYVTNRRVPVVRLFRYKEAFATAFVDEMLTRFDATPDDLVFDPFSGMGTTAFTAFRHNIAGVGIDRMPVSVFVGQTLPKFYFLRPGRLTELFRDLSAQVAGATPAAVATDVAIMGKAFSEETLTTLRKWKTVIESLEQPYRDVMLMLFLSVLEPCSQTAKDGQFLRIVPNKQVMDPARALALKVADAEDDIRALQTDGSPDPANLPRVLLGDARSIADATFERKPTIIITSPPYVNRYDYTRTYSLELCFYSIQEFSQLRDLRQSVLRSHIEVKVGADERPPHPSVEEVVDHLQAQGKALNNPRLPHMVTAYFVDMQKVIAEWARVMVPGGRAAMVVDNVRFDGQLVPVDLILSEMAEEVGFDVEEVLVARYKGNSSQQMGKFGRVPVRESVLVWRKR